MRTLITVLMVVGLVFGGIVASALAQDEQSDSLRMQLHATVVCAYIVQEGECNYSGRQTYVVNVIDNKAVKAVVQISSHGTQRNITTEVPAGGRTSLGCSVDSMNPNKQYTFKIVRCEIK